MQQDDIDLQTGIVAVHPEFLRNGQFLIKIIEWRLVPVIRYFELCSIRDLGEVIMRRTVMKIVTLAGLMVSGGVVQAEAAPRCVYRWVAETKIRTVTEVVYETINRNGRIVVVPRVIYRQVPYTTYRLVLDCGNPA